MPWQETDPMKQRMKFILACEDELTSHAEQCRRFGISRKTGYKWLERFELFGLDGIEERCRARHTQAESLREPMIKKLLLLKHKHQDWGPKKIRQWLLNQSVHSDVPAASTIGALFERHGLVKPRKRRRRAPPYTQPFSACLAANDVWSADFKGQFQLGNERWCYPFTLTDNHSRFLLACQGKYSTSEQGVRRCLEQAFRQYGLPVAFRTDNGTPFASNGLAGLSKLSVWLIRLGITVERIAPGKPSQNGRHERMHRSMKAAITCDSVKQDLAAQQRWFNQYRQSFNNERPHDALNGDSPSRHYKASSRTYDGKVPEVEYPDTACVRRVRSTGEIKWQGGLLFISNALIGQPVSLTEEADDLWCIRFGPAKLGHWDAIRRQIMRAEKR